MGLRLRRLVPVPLPRRLVVMLVLTMRRPLGVAFGLSFPITRVKLDDFGLECWEKRLSLVQHTLEITVVEERYQTP